MVSGDAGRAAIKRDSSVPSALEAVMNATELNGGPQLANSRGGKVSRDH